ncbi:MAG: preprotein translocase subunit SecE [Elusimicrobia bacterium RIFCSPHIGHO2_02_FULL_57_9]|nr:MAG: preprotein translocase subunit SecE [Elusimicrobia bacterium RIFCSPHIGHO2_02_FULL_57_9]
MNFAIQFLRESYFELKKASWLTPPQAWGSTLAVLLLVLLISLYVSGIDFILSVILGSVLGR